MSNRLNASQQEENYSHAGENSREPKPKWLQLSAEELYEIHITKIVNGILSAPEFLQMKNIIFLKHEWRQLDLTQRISNHDFVSE